VLSNQCSSILCSHMTNRRDKIHKTCCPRFAEQPMFQHHYTQQQQQRPAAAAAAAVTCTQMPDGRMIGHQRTHELLYAQSCPQQVSNSESDLLRLQKKRQLLIRHNTSGRVPSYVTARSHLPRSHLPQTKRQLKAAFKRDGLPRLTVPTGKSPYSRALSC